MEDTARLADAGHPGQAPRLPVEYERLLDEACKVAAGGECHWNERFTSALQRRGLALATARHPHDRDEWYPSGFPMQAPHPFPVGPGAWPEGSLVVWRPRFAPSPYEAWRIPYQSSEQAARAAWHAWLLAAEREAFCLAATRDAQHFASEYAQQVIDLRGQCGVLADLLEQAIAVCRTVEPGDGGIVEAEMLQQLIGHAERAISDVRSIRGPNVAAKATARQGGSLP